MIPKSNACYSFVSPDALSDQELAVHFNSCRQTYVVQEETHKMSLESYQLPSMTCHDCIFEFPDRHTTSH